MVTYRSLGELESAHDEESAAARRRLEDAEEHLMHYRSQIYRIQESVYQAVAQHGVADDPDFRHEFQRFADRHEEAAHEADRVVTRYQEQYEDLQREQSRERERFLQDHR